MKRINQIVQSPTKPSTPDVLWLNTEDSNSPKLMASINGEFKSVSGKDVLGTKVIVTVDSGTGTPSAEASVTDDVLTLNFHNLKGEKGEQGNTGSSVDYPFELVNNLTTNDATKALSAAQGVVLDGKISQLGQEVTDKNRVVTEAIAEHDAELNALEQARNLESEEVPCRLGQPVFALVDAAPTELPHSLGLLRFNPSNGALYVSKAVTGATSDWKQVL